MKTEDELTALQQAIATMLKNGRPQANRLYYVIVQEQERLLRWILGEPMPDIEKAAAYLISRADQKQAQERHA